MWDDIERIQTFIIDFFNSTWQQEQCSQKSIRDAFQVEVKGFSEFIPVNGRMYRYGFVSSDDRRTQSLARDMFHDNFQQFEQVVGRISGVSGWDTLRAPELKLHLLRHNQVAIHLKKHLPAPMHIVNTSSRDWLRGVYENIMRLNTDWSTNFSEWTDVEIVDNANEVVRAAIAAQTRDDISAIQNMLRRSTENAMMVDGGVYQDVETMITHVRTHLPHIAPLFQTCHGRIELVMAILAADANPRNVDGFYNILLLYLTKFRHQFSPLPSDARIYTSHEAAVDRAHFLEQYYETAMRSLQSDWASIVSFPPDESLPALVRRIPASTIKNYSDFTTLVDKVREKICEHAKQ